MKPRKLIEVAMPIKEISAESVRDKSIRHGHISTLHLWWARRPLPACRAVVFASLVPDPLDPNTPQAFRDAVRLLLAQDGSVDGLRYKTYPDIPYTAIRDPLPDNLTNRLLMFVGKFSEKCQKSMIAGNATSPKEQLAEGTLIKWESKNDPHVLALARELIYVAYNSERNPAVGYEQLHRDFAAAYEAISVAEQELLAITDRHLPSPEVDGAERRLAQAIADFQSRMPSVFDPFAGGGAIPLEAARLGCRSFGNDINPVAHIIERGSAEFPQRYGKRISYSRAEFLRIYGPEGTKFAEEKGISLGDTVEITNRLAFDVEFYAKRILAATRAEVGHLYPADDGGNVPVAYYWARTARCSNPSCQAEVPLLSQFNLVNNGKKAFHLQPVINGKDITFEVTKGKSSTSSWNRRGNITCPCCGCVTDVAEIRRQSATEGFGQRVVAVISEGDGGKQYANPTAQQAQILSQSVNPSERPAENVMKNSGGGDTLAWGFTHWGDLFSDRQLLTLNTLVANCKQTIANLEDSDYHKAIGVYLALWIDRVALVNTSFGRWNVIGEKLEHPYSRQAISIKFEYPESNPFCNSSGSALNHIEWITRYIESESSCPFVATFANASSGDKQQFGNKELTTVVTDPPYYDAIAYADVSDFFYVWLKRTLGNLFPLNFSTPQTPKAEECTAIKHHHNDDEQEATKHFESKLAEIFDAIERQTSDVVSIMFAHQSTKAWTTLCNSILMSRMNITGSWPIDTEMSNRVVGLSGTALESSVTVACRPSQRSGYGEFREVKRDIEMKVKEEIEKLYGLGFRGADLLTACFGQAVSEFGRYEVVEKADGSTVSVAELLEMVRRTAFDALLEGIRADDLTRFYIGWLQLNGMVECDYDDATKFTRVGVNVEISDIIGQRNILISTGSKVRLATAAERAIGHRQALSADAPLIDAVHGAMLAYRREELSTLSAIVRHCALDAAAPFWRVLASMKELLPAGPDFKDVQGLLQVQESLRAKARAAAQPDGPTLFD